jgi:queuine/archaeosine tRNA-ribosyltransferase
MLGPILTSIHNLRFFQRLMARMRSLIERNELDLIIEEFPVAGGPVADVVEE